MAADEENVSKLLVILSNEIRRDILFALLNTKLISWRFLILIQEN
jgi:hypothetical protein